MTDEDTRQLATIETVVASEPHPNADRLDITTIRGWKCITGRNQFTEGDRVVYFEIDSALPLADERFTFLGERDTKTILVNDEPRQVHRLKTIRLRKELSQGLVFPIEDFPEIGQLPTGTDVTSALGVVKYEPQGKGGSGPRDRGFLLQYKLPRFVPKTDAERVQNISPYKWPEDWSDWVATEKIDGTSTTYFYDFESDYFGTCSRNLMLMDGSKDWDGGGDQVQYGRRLMLDVDLREWGFSLDKAPRAIVVQGELAGPGWQGNGLQLPELSWFPFRVMVDGNDIPTVDWPQWLRDLAAPVLDVDGPADVQDALDKADALVSVVSPGRQPEGIVWRYEGDPKQLGQLPRCIKAISNKFLLKSQ